MLFTLSLFREEGSASINRAHSCQNCSDDSHVSAGLLGKLLFQEIEKHHLIDTVIVALVLTEVAEASSCKYPRAPLVQPLLLDISVGSLLY